MQFSLIKEDKINADLRQHALDGIAKLIQMDNDHAFKAKSRWDKKHPEDIKGKASGRIKNDDLFITSRTTKPRWDERPENGHRTGAKDGFSDLTTHLRMPLE